MESGETGIKKNGHRLRHLLLQPDSALATLSASS